MGRGRFGLLNVALLLASGVSLGFFLIIESKTASPFIPLGLFLNPVLSAGFVMSALVTNVVMATLVVGPFYLSGVFALDAARIGLVLSCGPLVAALTGLPAGRAVDRFGAYHTTVAGLIIMAVGAAILAMIPARFGVPGYIAPLVVITAGYALFQAANNTAVMTNVAPDQRGVIAGLLSLSRNLGLITGASVMGTVFALGVGMIHKTNRGVTNLATNVMAASPDAMATGMRLTFAVAAVIIAVAIAIALVSYALSRRATPCNREQHGVRFGTP
jgi:MFS family permease